MFVPFSSWGTLSHRKAEGRILARRLHTGLVRNLGSLMKHLDESPGCKGP